MANNLKFGTTCGKIREDIALFSLSDDDLEDAGSLKSSYISCFAGMGDACLNVSPEFECKK